MKRSSIIEMTVLALIAAGWSVPVRAQEMVTLPKVRLQELERKEKELEQLTGELARAREEQGRLENETERLKGRAHQLQEAKEAAETKAAVAVAATANTEPPIAHDTPSLESLPPWKKGDTVEAMDLMSHYRTEAGAAAKRYEAQRIQVRGEIVGFEKPSFVRPYVILLQTTEQKWRVSCRVEPPDQFSAVFTIQHGEELVGSTSAGARATLARVGQKVVIEGQCKGLRSQSVTLSGCRLVSVE
jgi:hypothetical protein